MTKLTDMQLVLLATACQRVDGSLLPPAESLGDQAARVRKAVETLVKKGFAVEKEDMATAQAWRTDGDLTIGVIVTEAGRTIIEPPAADGAPDADVASPSTNAATSPPARVASKQSQVLDLIKREEGAMLTDIVDATGWLPHTSRAALTGLRKKGHNIVGTKIDGITRYQIKATV